MKWFRYANKGSLGQLNLCLCVCNQCRGIKRCDFIDAGGTALLLYVCVCGRWGCEESTSSSWANKPIFSRTDRIKMCLSYWFQISIPWPFFFFYNENCLTTFLWRTEVFWSLIMSRTDTRKRALLAFICSQNDSRWSSLSLSCFG